MASGLALVVGLLMLLGTSFTRLAVGALKSILRFVALGLFIWGVTRALSGLSTASALWVIFGVGGVLVIAAIWFTLAWNRDFPDDKLGWDGKPVNRPPSDLSQPFDE